MSDRALFLRCGPGDVGDRAVLVGDRGRVALAAELLTDVDRLNEDRGLATITGTYAGRRITVSAFGMGAPVAAVVLHELTQLGVRSVVRLGTALAVRPALLGDLLLADAAVRGEGTSATYLPVEWPAVPDLALRSALLSRLAAQPRPYRSGLFASYDGFYTEMFTADHTRLGHLGRYGVVGLDMETSAVFVAARALGVAAASLCLATADAHTREFLDSRADAEAELLEIGLATLAGA